MSSLERAKPRRADIFLPPSRANERCPDRNRLAPILQIGLDSKFPLREVPPSMSAPRKLKKSESLEIRIPYPTKLAFMARCQAEGVSASEALRGFIDGQLDAAEP